jgi:hypothetical protein
MAMPRRLVRRTGGVLGTGHIAGIKAGGCSAHHGTNDLSRHLGKFRKINLFCGCYERTIVGRAAY